MIDLSQFCGANAINPQLNEPFSAGDYTYATDGKIGIRVPRRADADRKGPNLQAIMDNAPASANLAPLPETGEIYPRPAERETCEECVGFGYLEGCSECHGSGETECYACGHDCECKTCDGSGTKKVAVIGGIAKDDKNAVPCDECRGSGEFAVAPKDQFVEINPGLFFADSVLARLRTLPNLKFDMRPFDGRPHRFTFDGGDGVAMPMRPPSEDTKAT